MGFFKENIMRSQTSDFTVPVYISHSSKHTDCRTVILNFQCCSEDYIMSVENFYSSQMDHIIQFAINLCTYFKAEVSYIRAFN